jgi:hypothetical protein
MQKGVWGNLGKFHKQNMGITRIKHDSFGGRKNNGKIVG